MGLARALVVIAGGLATAAGASAAAHGTPGSAADHADPETQQTWKADEPADGPIQLIVSVPEQRVNVYVGGKLIAHSPVSTGREGYPTPTGVFSILQKKKYHRSNIYSRAPMPFMQRLTWSGIALHASDEVPDYPASHGCIRLPPEFAKALYRFTGLGAHVIVSGGEPAPVEISHPTLFQPAPPRNVDEPSAEATGVSDADALRRVATSVVGASRATSLLRRADAAAGPREAHRRGEGGPLRVLVTRRTGRGLVSDVQSLLKQLGFNPGDIDGLMGRETGAAIARFQKSRRLPPTGSLSDGLVSELYKAAGKGAPPTGHIYVRRDFAPVFDAPVAIAETERPLGTHLFTAGRFEADATKAPWLAVTLNDTAPDRLRLVLEDEGTQEGMQAAVSRAPVSAEEALDRIAIPASVRRRIAEMLTPGSSLAITDRGISRETIDKGTDFVVLTQ
jgi:hypothetical protein